jgi:hypothetical protein
VTESKPNDQIIPPDEIQAFAQHVKDDFLKKTVVYPPLEIELIFYPTHSAFKEDPKRSYAGTIFSERQDDHFIIHLCQACFKNITHLALQGMLDREMALCIQKLQSQFYCCDFKREIFPIMPVTGLAENHMREVVENLESALKNYLATQMLIEMGLGLPQVYFYFFKINPEIADPENYLAAIPHHWTRALFLCRKLIEFMSIFLLKKRNVDFCRDLESCWLKYNDYLLPEDLNLLETLAGLPVHQDPSPYPAKLVEMFKHVKTQLLASRKGVSTSTTLH